MKRYRVFDDRNNETLFESEDGLDCTIFITENYDEDSDDYPHVWIESFEKK